MAINRYRYYVGPLGYLKAMPAMVGGTHAPEVPMRLAGGLQSSLSGRVTRTRTGLAPKRSWILDQQNLTEADRLLLDAAISGSANAPLRLVDPRSSNQLPLDASVGGSLSLSSQVFEALASITDQFSRVTANGWGVTPVTAHVWTTGGGSAGDYSTDGSSGLVALATTATTRLVQLGVSVADLDQTISVKIPVVATGASINLSFALRVQGSLDRYLISMDFATSGILTYNLSRYVGGVPTVLATVTFGAYLANDVFKIRFQAIDSLLRAKVWKGASQPTNWSISVADTVISAAGAIEVEMTRLTGNTNGTITITWDDLSITAYPVLSFLAGSLPTSYLGVLAGAQNWAPIFNGNYLTATAEKCPIISGSTYRFSAWVKGNTTFKLMARPFNTSGVEQALASGSTETATGAYQRFSWLFTPGGSDASAYFGLMATAAGSIETTAWKVAIDESVLSDWTFGVGCPTVVVDNDIPHSYWRLKYYRMRLTLREV